MVVYNIDILLFSEASGADLLMSPRYIYIYLGLGIVFVLAWAYVCTFSPTRLRGPGNLLSNILFVYPPYEVAMPSETNSAKEQNVRNAPSRALRALDSRRKISKERDKK